MKLEDDLQLLEIMLADSDNQSSLFQPGPYWATSAMNAVNEIRRSSIRGFRGSTNLIGLSYSDHLDVDIRNQFNHGLRRLVRWMTMVYPLNRIYEAQIRRTEAYANEGIAYAEEILNMKDRTRHLLTKYRIPESLLGGCLRKATIDGSDYAVHYLSLLDRHDHLASRINFGDARAIIEIGPGFGANIHLLLANYRGLKKILYLDIPPALYVGTQYLKAFYGAAVCDYRDLRCVDNLTFSAEDTLEIFCIAPWQLGTFKGAIDVFMNSNSFVEMPHHVVRNYVERFRDLPESKDAAIALTSYDGFDLSTTFHPDELPRFFAGRSFDYFEEETLVNSSRRNLFFVSSGRLSQHCGK